ncbi:MAG TPA: glycosyltransferase family 2 protein [Stellaceae bacterium]|nr:glycosyltransferase family 2 protein [Stellaceae bacterium]
MISVSTINDQTETCADDRDTDPGRASRIAVLIPCYNEELSVARVVHDFRRALPRAAIYVYDNNSVDRTREAATDAGAIVRVEPLQGKGNVVRRMFADVEADVYVLVDGDDTYDAACAPEMVRALLEGQLDMVSARRVSNIKTAYRPGHRFGNTVLTSIVASIFGKTFADMLSGYRVFSRRFVKSFPALATGFEIETELTVHTLELRMPTLEIDTPYKDRLPGSESKLRTYIDGLRILKTILRLIKEERPLQFFATFFGILTVFSLAISVPVFIEYARTGLVPRLPTAVLATGTMLLGFLSLAAGVILDTVTLGRREAKRMRYLEIPAPEAGPR